MLSLAVAAASLAYVGPLSAPVIQRRASVSQMAAEKKVLELDEFNQGLFEVREVDVSKPPVQLLSRLEELKAATTVSELGLLSLAEENQVFSKLESAGAFSTIEKLLPTIESLGLLSTVEGLFDVEAGLIFTVANTLLAFPFILLLLQGFAFLPGATGVGVPLEVLLDLASAAAGAALFALAYAISLLQGD